MNVLTTILYDPTTAATKATSSLIAMTAFDTTNLRLAVTVPSHGIVMFKMRCAITGATTVPTVLLGVLNGATVVARVTPLYGPFTANIATQSFTMWAEFVVTGLTPGAANFDAAYAVQVVVASTNIKYGGPNNTTGANAWGAFVFEAWDPKPNPTNFGAMSIDANGRLDMIKLAGTTQTARDIGASVLLSTGTGTGQLDFTSGVVKANAVQLLGTAWLTPVVAGTPDVNTKLQGNVTQTGRDLGASVLLSAGTGAGQLDFTSGVVKANAVQLLGTAWLTPVVAGTPDVNCKLQGNVSQTGRDLGASVLLSTGTGAGQLDFTAGVVKANAVQLLGTAWLTPGTAGTPDVNSKLQGGTVQTGRDLGASVLLSSGTGTGQLSLSSGTVTVGTNNDKTGYTASTVSDKTGYSLSAGGVQAIWDALTSALTTAGSIGKLLVDNINATISSRLASASITLSAGAVTVGTNNDKTGYTASTVSDKTGYALTSAYDPAKTAAQAGDAMTLTAAYNSAKTASQAGDAMALTAGAVTAIWDKLTSALTTAGSIGKLLVDNIDAAISSRSTYAGADTSGTTTLLGRLTGTRASNLDSLDATVSSRLATSGYTAPSNSDITAIKAKTDSLTFTVAGKVDGNIRSVNGTTVNGNGSGATPWGP